MNKEQANVILKEIISHPDMKEQQQIIYNAVMPLKFLKMLPQRVDLGKAVQAFSAGEFDKLKKIAIETNDIMQGREQMLATYISRVPPISDAELIALLKSMDTSKMANPSSNIAYYRQRLTDTINDPSKATFRQTAAMLGRAFGHDIGEILRSNWRSNLKGAPAPINSNVNVKAGLPKWVLPALAVGAMFLI